MKGLQSLLQISIRTNERDIEFTSFNEYVHIKQSLDGETSSVVLSQEEFNMIHSMNNDNLSRYMGSIFNKKAL
ncbi:cytoplasmic protein [Bacillus cereus]|nr:cytoplasmic protein [Bacillus cereus]